MVANLVRNQGFLLDQYPHPLGHVVPHSLGVPKLIYWLYVFLGVGGPHRQNVPSRDGIPVKGLLPPGKR